MATDAAARESAYAPCALCEFNVARDAPTCPNCGIQSPADTFFWQSSGYKHTPTLAQNVIGVTALGGLAALGVAMVIHMMPDYLPWVQDLQQWTVALSGGVGLVAAGFLGWCASLNTRQSRFRKSDCFQQIEASLNERTQLPAALKTTGQQIVSRLEELRAQGKSAAELEQALASVRAADAEAQRQSLQAEVMLERIHLLRWQNRLEPLIMAPPLQASVESWQQCREQLDEIRAAGEPLAEALARRDDLLCLPEGRDLLAAWQEALAACEQLKNELLTQQAAAAVEGLQTPAFAESEAEAAFARARAVVRLGSSASALTDLRSQETRLDEHWKQTEAQTRAAGQVRA